MLNVWNTLQQAIIALEMCGLYQQSEKSYLVVRTDYFMHAEMLVKYRPYPTHPSPSTPSLPSLSTGLVLVFLRWCLEAAKLYQVWIIPGRMIRQLSVSQRLGAGDHCENRFVIVKYFCKICLLQPGPTPKMSVVFLLR